MPGAPSKNKKSAKEKLVHRRTSSHRIELAHDAERAESLAEQYPIEEQKKGYAAVRLSPLLSLDIHTHKQTHTARTHICGFPAKGRSLSALMVQNKIAPIDEESLKEEEASVEN